jgi:DNA-binding CsgD family transcriptional regulator/PAS domain-containing protein
MEAPQAAGALESVRMLYQALEHTQDWDHALTTLANDVGADHVVLDLRSSFEAEPEQVLSARVDPWHVQRFSQHREYAMLRQMLRGAPVGVAMHERSLLDAQVQARSEFYADVIRPMGGHHALLALTPQGADGSRVLLAACRSSRKNAFETQDCQRLQSVLPHLETVLRLKRRLSRHSAELWWREQVLSKLPIGVILLTARGLPCYLNPAAEALINEGQMLSLSMHHGLSTADPQTTRQLRLAVQTVLNGSPGQLPAPWPIRVAHPHQAHGDLWLRVTPLTLGGAASEAWTEARAMVFCDGPLAQALDGGQLASMFGLTPREAALAQALLAGHDLAGAAQSLGVGLETVRTQLKSLFGKTGTARQADLLRTLASLQRWSM